MTEFLSIWKPEDLSLDLNSMQYDAIHLPNIADARIYVNGEADIPVYFNVPVLLTTLVFRVLRRNSMVCLRIYTVSRIL
jgi:hypothetical protein